MTRPPKGSPEELVWLRGFEAGVQQMRADQQNKILEAEKQGYYKGFMASAEGSNGEYPYWQEGRDPLDDPRWISRRDAELEKEKN